MDDILILGSEISTLSFAALMAKAGRKVVLIEAHEYPGGTWRHFYGDGQISLQCAASLCLKLRNGELTF